MVFVQKLSAPALGSLADATQYLNEKSGSLGRQGLPRLSCRWRPARDLQRPVGHEGAYRWNRGRNVSYLLTKGDYIYFLSLTYANATRPANKAALLAALQLFRVVAHA